MADADAVRARSFAAFDSGRSAQGEELWDRYLGASPGIEGGLAQAAQQLETALSLDIRRDDVRERLLGVLWKRALEAEQGHRGELAVRDHIERMKFYDQSGEFLRRWDAPVELSVSSDPIGVHIALERYVVEGGHLRGEPAGTLGIAPMRSQLYPQGSYRLRLELPGRATVLYPVVLRRGEAVDVVVALPPLAKVPQGFVYIPEGRFSYGSGEIESVREFLRAEPIHVVETGPYLIGRTEVTFAECIEFLAAQPAEERAARLKAMASGPTWLEELPDDRWRITLTVNGLVHTAESGALLVYKGRTQRANAVWEQLPVSGIDSVDAGLYMAWLNHSGKVPGARYCDEHEWERAARGADERFFASGNELFPADANFDATYGKLDSAFGPDPVGSFPQTTSPFGLLDTDGNVYEMTVARDGDHVIIVRGGAYFYAPIQARATARFDIPVNLRDTTLGLRVCATWPPPSAP